MPYARRGVANSLFKKVGFHFHFFNVLIRDAYNYSAIIDY